MAGMPRGVSASVDRGTCGLGIEQRKSRSSGCRRRSIVRKATPATPLTRGVYGPRGVGDPTHARKHLERNPGYPGIDLAAYARPARRIRKSTAAMNDARKSDKLIVPMKPPNKMRGGQPCTAEGVEGRGLTKGNPTEPRSSWTQCQIEPPQGFKRIRNALDASTPEVGARCGNAARRDLCGGWPVRAIPLGFGPFFE